MSDRQTAARYWQFFFFGGGGVGGGGVIGPRTGGGWDCRK